MNKLAHNERIRVLATFLHNLAVASIAGGSLATVFTHVGMELGAAKFYLVFGMLFGGMCLVGGQAVLGTLRE